MKTKLLSLLTVFLITFSICQSQTSTPTLYGLTVMGGDYNNGNIFQYQAGTIFKSAYSFSTSPGGQFPWGSLIFNHKKLLYGMTKEGGASNFGTLFSFSISTGKDSVLHSFTNSGGDGAGPYGSPLQVNDSMLYGMTTSGGTSIMGTIFSYNINTGTELSLYSFAGGATDGEGPYGALTQVNDSMLYGTTLFGGSDDSGAIISYNIKSNKENLVHSFIGGEQDGGDPSGSLLLVNDSLLYGLTTYGGSAGTGAIIKYNFLKGNESVVYSFTIDTYGLYPYSSFIQANNGLLYGTTVSSGATGNGVVFSFDITTNTEKLVHNFPDLNGGERPYGAVIQASDGDLYGLTTAGGANNDGVLYSYDITNSTYTDLVDFNGYNAWEPYFGNVVEADTSGTSGVDQVLTTNGDLSIYPNPNNGQFSLKLNSNQIGCTLEVYNLVGEIVYQSVLSNSQNTINLTGQPDGMYFVYLKGGNGMEVEKVLLTK